MYVCLFITLERKGRLSLSRVHQGWFFLQNLWEGVMARNPKISIFVSRGTSWPCAMAGRLGTAMATGQAVGAHTGTNG